MCIICIKPLSYLHNYILLQVSSSYPIVKCFIQLMWYMLHPQELVRSLKVPANLTLHNETKTHNGNGAN